MLALATVGPNWDGVSIENEAVAGTPRHSCEGLRPMMDWRAREWTGVFVMSVPPRSSLRFDRGV
jgi:hypothetical protein